MSQVTKRAIQQAFKDLAKTKPMNKIAVHDITDFCGISRMTFYYHYEDIYDLIEKTLAQDMERILDGKKSYSTWQAGYRQIFEATKANRDFIHNVYSHLGRKQIENCLYPLTRQLLYNVLLEKKGDRKIKEEDLLFTADFYKYGLVGLVLEWIDSGMKENPDTIIKRLNLMVYGSMDRALDAFEQEN